MRFKLFILLAVLSYTAPGTPASAQSQALPRPIAVPPPEPTPPYYPFPHLPAPPLDERNNGIGVAQQTARRRGLQGRVLWIDATANLARMNTPEKIAEIVARVKRTGFNTLVLDVKPIVGYTLYPSRFAPKLNEWLDRRMPPEFDPVAEFVRQARQTGIQIVACMNVFSEGHRNVMKGPGYDNPQWQTVLYEPQPQVRAPSGASYPLSDLPNRAPRNPADLVVYTDLSAFRPAPGMPAAVVDAAGRVQAVLEGAAVSLLDVELPSGAGLIAGTGAAADWLRMNVRPGDTLTFGSTPLFVPIGQRPEQQVPLMVNPHNPQVQQRILDMVTEVLTTYEFDGVIFDDRLRYAGMNADFSYETQAQFEQYLGRKIQWPDEVFRYDLSFPALTRTVIPGREFEAWLLFRALTMRNWLARAVATARAARPGVQVAVYAGSWYGEYPAYGVNWAADDFDAGFSFLTPSYRKTGFAGLLDWMTTGAYYPSPTIQDALRNGRIPGASVEAAGQLANRAANDQTWTYCGIMIQDYSGRPEALKAAIQAACASTQGIMVFDLSHFDLRGNENLWAVFEEAFRQPATAPHAAPGLLAQVKREKARRKAAGIKDPPVIIYGGIPGTGF